MSQLSYLEEISITTLYKGAVRVDGALHNFTAAYDPCGWGSKIQVSWWTTDEILNGAPPPSNEKAAVDQIERGIVAYKGES